MKTIVNLVIILYVAAGHRPRELESQGLGHQGHRSCLRFDERQTRTRSAITQMVDFAKRTIVTVACVLHAEPYIA